MNIVTILKFILVSILSVIYWPINTLFLYMQKYYRRWATEDRVSYIIATPLYYLFFVIVAILSIPLELLGEGLHPPLKGFR